MIEVVIFYVHVIFFVYIFTKNFVEENLQSAILSTIFVIILFSVGWTLSAFFVSSVIPEKGFTKILTSAAYSLVLLSLLELVFYKFFYSRKPDAVKPV